MSAPPAGYQLVRGAGNALAVVRNSEADAVSSVLEAQTLHAWAAHQPARRALHGRGVAWAVALPGGTNVVVRHSRHGGALAGLTGDRFLAPTRAPHELSVSLWLQSSGVHTPTMIAYATYPAGPLLRRSDVVTAEVPGARDLGSVCMEGGAELDAALDSTGILLDSLARAGAHHPDLNVKNVLLADGGAAFTAWVLDVDRVRRVNRRRAARGNLRRLVHSMERWRQRKGAPITNEHLARLSALVEET